MTISFFLGVVSAVIYYENKIESINEDILSKEISLTSSISNKSAPCEELLTSDNWIQENQGKYSVFWQINADQTMIAKLVIDSDYSSAIETFANGCHN